MDVLLLFLRLSLALLLYAFLGGVFWILWRDLRRAAEDRSVALPAMVARPQGQLLVIRPPDDPSWAETMADVEQPAFPLQVINSLGRSPVNTIHIPDTYASAQHALLTWREGQWWLEDQGSRNGTLLNDACITGPTVVSAGDVIGIGQARLKLVLD